jgi:hypothetical protein
MANTHFTGPVYSANGFVGNLTGDIAGNVVSPVAAKSGAGAIPLTATTVQLTTTGANALTLADGVNGQRLSIVMVASGGNGTLTPATKTGFTTATFTAVGNAVTLQFFTTLGWMVIANYGATVA